MIDIHSRGPWPSCALSNFAEHPFKMDNRLFGSIEGFLQGLKIKDPKEQAEVFKLHGLKAKLAGPKMKNDTMWYNGCPINRHSEAYKRLLVRAYIHMFNQNKSFRDALRATGDKTLVHTIGCENKFETILTNQEFCGILTSLRRRL
ncbi:hypothetical protein KNT81_gp061 [Proteus phage phiP4-3]|uniref:Uncharacterized protein n=1 Tax=Proteus phage phiP4-3 TaxID=2065203 RepID=A0A2I6PFC0_9CAUD|nr:hypothetical protein KNT81_gp061 [Proteus phage phiP4-3]AUM58419.1 hypothetical protein phiP43_061 [Proteus phage phiP4-3]